MLNIVTVRKQLFAETSLWAQRVQAAGGGFETNSVAIANNLVRQIRNSSFGGKMIYLLPMLGTGIGAARVPLIDALNVGAATNTAFVNADFSQSTGLQGNGSTKYLNGLIKPSQIGSSNSGGIGYWENNINLGGNVEPMGCYDSVTSQRFVIDLRSSRTFFSWGSPANGINSADGASTNGHYYGQRASAIDRNIYRNAGSLGTNTTSDTATGASGRNMLIVGADEAGVISPWPGRCALAYMTDGTMTASDITLFDSMLRDYLMGPTGKPQT